jgi:hypothetical protein
MSDRDALGKPLLVLFICNHCPFVKHIRHELAAIGRLTIRRATTIEFSETSQQWEVRDAGGALLHSHPSREICLEWEHRHFNQ